MVLVTNPASLTDGPTHSIHSPFENPFVQDFGGNPKVTALLENPEHPNSTSSTSSSVPSDPSSLLPSSSSHDCHTLKVVASQFLSSRGSRDHGLSFQARRILSLPARASRSFAQQFRGDFPCFFPRISILADVIDSAPQQPPKAPSIVASIRF